MNEQIKAPPETELEECKTKISALTYELTRAYAETKKCRAAVRQLPVDARFQAACAAMQGMLANPTLTVTHNPDNLDGKTCVAIAATSFADALLDRLAAQHTEGRP